VFPWLPHSPAPPPAN